MAYNGIECDSFTPLKNNVFVSELEAGPSLTRGGIILPDDNMRESGIRDRWGKVYSVGPEVDDLKPGDWVLVAHGRWTTGIDLDLPEGRTRVWRVEYPEAVLLASDVDPRVNLPTDLSRVR